VIEMSEEISVDALVRATTKAVRVVIREELERSDKQVARELLKIALADMGAKKGSGEKHVITAGKG
jgi:hypothetical protein